MSTAAALAALAVSAALVILLCLGDPKRRRAAGLAGQSSRARRRSLALAALAPGVVCASNGDAAAFLIWLGGSVLAGWGAALWAARRPPQGPVTAVEVNDRRAQI
jgi:hypothetical protein